MRRAPTAPVPGRCVGARPASGAARLTAGGVAGLCLSVLVVAACLTPSPTGEGTHTQLGLAPCHWASLLGRPCPTCGMTTAFAHAADARFIEGFLAQPLGLVLALVTAAGFWASLHVAATGSNLARWGRWTTSPRVLWAAGAAAAGAWVYKLMTWNSAGF